MLIIKNQKCCRPQCKEVMGGEGREREGREREGWRFTRVGWYGSCSIHWWFKHNSLLDTRCCPVVALWYAEEWIHYSLLQWNLIGQVKWVLRRIVDIVTAISTSWAEVIFRVKIMWPWRQLQDDEMSLTTNSSSQDCFHPYDKMQLMGSNHFIILHHLDFILGYGISESVTVYGTLQLQDHKRSLTMQLVHKIMTALVILIQRSNDH